MSKIKLFRFSSIYPVIVLSLVFGARADASELLGIRWNEGPNNTRVVLDLSDETEFKYAALEDPPRIYIDLEDTHRTKPIAIRDLDSRILRTIRHSAQKNGQKYRVVLDVARPIESKVFALGPYRPYGNRVVIDLRSETKVEDCSTDNQPHEDVVIVLDAGHGGEDPGAVGQRRIYEKRVTLGIARAAKAALENIPGFKVVMTRDGDYEVTLDTRRNIALQERAHMFVSIHADSFKRPEPRGASVFVLSNGKAQTELDRWFVNNENRSDWTGGISSWVNSRCFDDPNNYLFLNERARDVVLDNSVALGKRVLDELSRVTYVHPKALTKNRSGFRVTDAGFKVLKSTQVPSILVETGFLSNPKEAQELAKPSHQVTLGEAIALGVAGYFCDNPPWHTRLSRGEVQCDLKRSYRKYRVRRGDTLLEIALENQVSLTSLRRSNNLNSDTIYVDQVLTIPTRTMSN